jgi:hypothetical protein
VQRKAIKQTEAKTRLRDLQTGVRFIQYRQLRLWDSGEKKEIPIQL